MDLHHVALLAPEGARLSVASPRIRSGFVTAADGVRLYWRAVGEGPAIVCCNGVGVSIFFWKYVVQHYAPNHTVVLWDYRCHGRSDRPSLQTAGPGGAVGDLAIERHAEDLRCVLDALELDQVMLIGHSMGCQVVFEFQRRHPARVLAMIPMLGSAGKTLETFYDFKHSPAIFRALSAWLDGQGDRIHFVVRPLLESPLAWVLARKLSLVDPCYCKEEDLRPYIRHLATLDLRVFLHAVLACQEHDAWSALPQIRVPVLVVAAERDTFTPMWLSRKMVGLIRGADFLVLAEGSHAALIEQPETIVHRIDRFLAERNVFGAARADARMAMSAK